ncbi:prepilin-type N-terminal cleavage/methylation domain-containing protein, partial [Marinobacter sp.]|uniref:prepilin-type N-terminal cleavage/methylation domain-containing protein n=1 Tax=Marinobacter sp. TaxID=50741 RepID=UPI0019E457F7
MAGVWKAGWVSALIFLKDMSLKYAGRLVLGVVTKNVTPGRVGAMLCGFSSCDVCHRGMQHPEYAFIFNIILHLARWVLNLSQAQRGWLGMCLTARALIKETTTLEVDNMQEVKMNHGQKGFTLIELMIVVA